MTGLMFAILRRDLLLALRQKSDVLSVLLFFLLVASLFPLGIGPEPALLRTLAPGVLWVAALLAGLLGLPRLFESDFRDGCLAQMALSPQPFALVVLAKIVAHWGTSALPLVLLAPLIGLQFDLAAGALSSLMLTLLLGTPALSAIGAIGAALTLGLRGGGVLLSLLVLPLYVPVLVFGAGAVAGVVAGIDVASHYALLAAFSLISLSLAPWATAAALRLALE